MPGIGFRVINFDNFFYNMMVISADVFDQISVRTIRVMVVVNGIVIITVVMLEPIEIIVIIRKSRR